MLTELSTNTGQGWSLTKMARVGKGVELDLDLQPGMSGWKCVGSKQLATYTHGRTCWRAARSQHARSNIRPIFRIGGLKSWE